jgi:transcription elongation GreA/GreB family factor
VLTAEGHDLLSQRARRLRESTLPELRPLLQEWERDERMVAEFERAQAELDRLEHLLAEAEVLQPDPDAFDGRVRLGARIVLELPDGERTTVRLVHPEEAFLDDERVSATSPLAVAVLGARVGHTVWVAAPSGPWPCRVVDVVVDGRAA